MPKLSQFVDVTVADDGEGAFALSGNGLGDSCSLIQRSSERRTFCEHGHRSEFSF